MKRIDLGDRLILTAASAMVVLSILMIGCAADVEFWRKSAPPPAAAAPQPAEKPTAEDLIGGLLTATTRISADPGVRGAASLTPWGELALTVVGGAAAGGLAVLSHLRATRRKAPPPETP